MIPPAVADELSHEKTPEVVRVWLAGHPSWLEIRQPACALADLQESFERLRHTNFRVNAELLQSLLEEHRRGMQE